MCKETCTLMFCSKIFTWWWWWWWKKGWQSDIRYTRHWEHETSINYKVFASCVKQFSMSVQVIYINCRDHIRQQLITSFVIRTITSQHSSHPWHYTEPLWTCCDLLNVGWQDINIDACYRPHYAQTKRAKKRVLRNSKYWMIISV